MMAYLVIDHLIPPSSSSTAPSSAATPTDSTLWQRLDDIVRHWIYGTISNDLLNTIINPDDKAVDVWNRLVNFFQLNKSARALHLDAQFTNTGLEQFFGVKPYCTRLKVLADSQRNVGDTVSNNRMALQLLKGFSNEYKQFRSSVQHLHPLPSFDTLRSMLELEEQSNDDGSSVLRFGSEMALAENGGHYSGNNNNHSKGVKHFRNNKNSRNCNNNNNNNNNRNNTNSSRQPAHSNNQNSA
ncbi:putative uncharacterized protein DDB_G0277255 [Chenopodium quinoa]|uniref:putative uncharacterized protein DDB_G0277255 n=1 Tax=Chenopodium quinoa TaxID=63459 RepID=UPI000B781EE5|nr:putative uncharacterized protein DDB_G0277255 [Chenopodium quinoa]